MTGQALRLEDTSNARDSWKSIYNNRTEPAFPHSEDSGVSKRVYVLTHILSSAFGKANYVNSSTFNEALSLTDKILRIEENE